MSKLRNAVLASAVLSAGAALAGSAMAGEKPLYGYGTTPTADVERNTRGGDRTATIVFASSSVLRTRLDRIDCL